MTLVSSISVIVKPHQANSHLNNSPRIHVAMSTDSNLLLVASAERKINVYN